MAHDSKLTHPSAHIPATCTVDDLGGMQYEVSVQGAFHAAAYSRKYTVKATSEDAAAQEGLRLFCDEIEALLSAKDD